MGKRWRVYINSHTHTKKDNINIICITKVVRRTHAIITGFESLYSGPVQRGDLRFVQTSCDVALYAGLNRAFRAKKMNNIGI
jgi:hypothetical protein